MTTANWDDEKYFTLLVEYGKEVSKELTDNKDAREFWRQRINTEWIHVNSLLMDEHAATRKMSPADRADYLMSGVARLAREALLAAWYFGAWEVEGIDDPAFIASELTEITGVHIQNL